MLRILVDIEGDAPPPGLAADPGIALDIARHDAVARHDAKEPLAPERLADAEVLFCTDLPPDFAPARRLKWMQITSAGYEHLQGLGLAERGLQVTNALGIFDGPIAEWNLAMMINLVRDLRQMIRNQERGHWERTLRFQQEIRGLTVGIWGYGGIGRETARLAKAVGMRVHVINRSPVGPRRGIYSIPGMGDPEGTLPDRVFGMDEKAAFLRDLDFLVLAIPHKASTAGIVGEAELRALPRHAFLLNPARGPLVEQASLLRALREGWIAGAALDTHYQYPLPPEHPLWKMENLILTPHISGSHSQRFSERVWSLLAENVKRYRAGEPLLNELTPAQLRGE